MIEKGIDFAVNVASQIFTASGERMRPTALTVFLASAKIFHEAQHRDSLHGDTVG